MSRAAQRQSRICGVKLACVYPSGVNVRHVSFPSQRGVKSSEPCFPALLTRRQSAQHKKEKGHVMLKQKKFRQVTLIVIATAVILILPNLSRIIS